MKEEIKKSIVFENKWISWVVITFAAIVYTLSMQIFMNVAGTFPTGVMSIAVILSYVFKGLSPYLSLIYLALNVPLLIIYWKKSKRRWMYKTTYFLIIQAAFGFLFVIPEVKEWFQLSFFHGMKLEGTDLSQKVDFIRGEIWPIILLSSFGAAFAGFSMALTWKYGGSTGGTDIVVSYLSNVKNKSVGKISRIISIFICIVSFAIIVAINANQRKLWLPILTGTIIYVFITTLIIDKIYPKFSKVRVAVYSTKTRELSALMKEQKFIHSWNIHKLESGYSGATKEMISTTIFLIELRDFLRMVYEVDPEVWISVVNIRASYGKFNKSKLEEITE